MRINKTWALLVNLNSSFPCNVSGNFQRLPLKSFHAKFKYTLRITFIVLPTANRAWGDEATRAESFRKRNERLRSVRSVLSETVNLLKIESMSKVGACKYQGSSSYFTSPTVRHLLFVTVAGWLKGRRDRCCHLEIQLDESRRRWKPFHVWKCPLSVKMSEKLLKYTLV